MKKSYSFIIIWFFIFLCFLFQRTNADEFSKEWLVSRFEKFDFVINRGEGYSQSTNESGALAWGESYLLEAYLDMWEATQDERYIKKFADHANRVISNTDKARDIKDYKGRLRMGWSVTKYSKDEKPMVHLVHSAMILYPLVKFCFIIKKQDKIVGYDDIADNYLNFVQGAVSEFEGQWRFNPLTGEGSYWFEGDEPLETDLLAPMPFNGPLAMGRVLILLYQITKDEVYLKKVKALALNFKNNLIETKDGYYIWGYRPNLEKYPQMEDISHGAIAIDFAVLAYKNGIVFQKSDMDKFAKTLLNAKKKAKRFAFSKFVDGTDDPVDKPYSNSPGDVSGVAVGRWLELSSFSCEVYRVIYDYMKEKIKSSTKEHPAVMLGIAKLIKYSACLTVTQ